MSLGFRIGGKFIRRREGSFWGKTFLSELLNGGGQIMSKWVTSNCLKTCPVNSLVPKLAKFFDFDKHKKNKNLLTSTNVLILQ